MFCFLSILSMFFILFYLIPSYFTLSCLILPYLYYLIMSFLILSYLACPNYLYLFHFALQQRHRPLHALKWKKWKMIIFPSITQLSTQPWHHSGTIDDCLCAALLRHVATFAIMIEWCFVTKRTKLIRVNMWISCFCPSSFGMMDTNWLQCNFICFSTGECIDEDVVPHHNSVGDCICLCEFQYLSTTP